MRTRPKKEEKMLLKELEKRIFPSSQSVIQFIEENFGVTYFNKWCN